MRLIALGLIFVFCFGAICGQQNIETKNGNFCLTTSNFKKSNDENVKVTVYADGKFQSVMTFTDGFLKEQVNYDIGKQTIAGITKYYYTKTGKIIRAEDWENRKKKSRKGYDQEFYIDLTAKYLYSADFLKQKGIQIPLPGLIFSQIKDTANIFFAGDSRNDFKKEISTNGEFKTIKFIGFNKRIRFDPTLLEISMDQTITDYELILKNGYLFKEVYKTGPSDVYGVTSSEITREYSYIGNCLMKLVTTINSTRKDGTPYNEVNKLEFVYKNSRL